MPLDQWLYFDALDCLPEDGEPLPKPEDCAPVRTGVGVQAFSKPRTREDTGRNRDPDLEKLV